MRKVPRNRAKIERSSPLRPAAPPVTAVGLPATTPTAEVPDEDGFPGTLTIAELVGPDDADLLILRELVDSPVWTTDPLGVARQALMDSGPTTPPSLPAQPDRDAGRPLAPTPVPLESLQSLPVSTGLL
jgi:hypothetical protein